MCPLGIRETPPLYCAAHRARWSCTTALGSGLADTLATDLAGINPDEVLGFALHPRLKAEVGNRCTLGLGVYVMGSALDEHHPSHPRFGISLVDLHSDLVLGKRDTSTQVLLGEDDPVGAENDRSFMDLVLGRQRHRPKPAVVNQAPDLCGAEQLHAFGLIQALHHAPGTHSRAGRIGTSRRTEVGLVIRHSSTP